MGVKLVFPRGFCFGVKKAIDLLEETVLKYRDKPIFVYNEIVHNKQIIEHFKRENVCFIQNLDEIKDKNSVVVFSAHGVDPKIKNKAIDKGLIVVDATCPIVQTNHKLAKKYSNLGYTIVIIGDILHDEIQGLIGEIDGEFRVIYTIDDIKSLDIPSTEKLTYITQTTLNIDDTKNLIETLTNKFPNIEPINESQICFATKERQDALKNNLEDTDLVLVCGSKNSSNSNKLVSVAKENISPKNGSYLVSEIEDLGKINFSDSKEILITSGASVPEGFTMQVYKKVIELKNKD